MRIARLVSLHILSVWFGGCAEPPDSIQPLFCGVTYADGRCELKPDRTFALHVRQPSADSVTILQGWKSLPIQRKAVRDGLILRGQAAAGVARLRLLLRSGWRWRWQTVELTDNQNPDWLKEAEEAWLNNQGERGQKVVQEQLRQRPNLAAVTRAKAFLLLARIAQELPDPKDATKTPGQARTEPASAAAFRQAISAAQAGGALSLEQVATIELADLLARRLLRNDEAETLLRGLEPQLSRVPEMAMHVTAERAFVAHQLGDPRSALEHIAAAQRDSERFDMPLAAVQLQLRQADVLAVLGRLTESQRILSTLIQGKLPPCYRVDVLIDAAWYFIVAERAAQDAQSTPLPLTPYREAEAHLLEAEKLITSACDDHRRLTVVRTNLVHLAILAGDANRAEQWLRQARKEGQTEAADLRIEWLDQQGQIELLRGEFAAAWASYTQLAQLAQRRDAYSYEWRALVGKAEAQENTNAEAAIALYHEAESLLDRRGLDMPLGAGRGTFLGRHERSARLLLDLLVRRGEAAEALEVVRRAQQRGHRQLLALSHMAEQGAHPSGAWQTTMQLFQKERQDLDALVQEIDRAPVSDVPALEAARADRSRHLLSRLEDLLRLVTPSPPTAAFAPLPPATGMLACRPGRSHWVCLYADSAGVAAVRQSPPPHGPALTTWAQQLVSSFAARIAAQQRLRVLAYGAVREIDFLGLSIDATDRWLGEELAVSSALDLPRLPPPSASPQPQPLRDDAANPPTPAKGETTSPGQAILIMDPDGSLPYSREAAPEIAKTLRNAGLEVRALNEPVAAVGQWAGQPTRKKKQSLLQQIQQTTSAPRLFLYAGHAQFVASGGTMHFLQANDGAGLLVSDILALPDTAVPQAVALFGCNTGQSAEETGGAEGIGLAQAFMLRGSRWALGTIRPVGDRVASELAQAFVQEWTHSKTESPARVLATARRVVLSAPNRGRSTDERQDLSAFRIFEP